MPIGTIIGWLIGQFAIGLIIYGSNDRKKDHRNTELAQITRANCRILGMIFMFTGFTAFMGTMLELILR